MNKQDVRFAGQLFVVAPEYLENQDYKVRYLGNAVAAGKNTVNVLAVNAKNADEIINALEYDKNLVAESIQTSKDKNSLQKQLDFLNSSIEMMNNSVFVKTPDNALLEFTSNKMNKTITTGDVKYLSGISHIYD